jgi:hypothetical protein
VKKRHRTNSFKIGAPQDYFLVIPIYFIWAQLDYPLAAGFIEIRSFQRKRAVTPEQLVHCATTPIESKPGAQSGLPKPALI